MSYASGNGPGVTFVSPVRDICHCKRRPFFGILDYGKVCLNCIDCSGYLTEFLRTGYQRQPLHIGYLSGLGVFRPPRTDCLRQAAVGMAAVGRRDRALIRMVTRLSASTRLSLCSLFDRHVSKLRSPNQNGLSCYCLARSGLFAIWAHHSLRFAPLLIR